MKRLLVAVVVLAAVATAGVAQASHFGRMACLHHQSPSTMHHHPP